MEFNTMSKNLVVKDNALINASYSLDLIEQRLILLAIAQARQTGQELTATTKLHISVSDYIDVYSVQGRSVYENIKGACKTLFERQFTYTEQQKKGIRVATSRWVSEIAYNSEQSSVDITFAPAVVPLITMLEKHFTSYDLEQVAGLKSKYAIRLYEIIIAWRKKGKTPQIDVEQLRGRLGVEQHEYTIMADFKKRVLDTSVQEITDNTDIIISYDQHKQGRKIVGFTFAIKTKTKPKQAPKDDNRDKNTVDLLDNLTDKEREIIANKNAYADHIGADKKHRENLIRQGIDNYRKGQKQEKERKEREQAERQAKKAQDKAELERAKRIYQTILENDRLINSYIAHNIQPQALSGLQRIKFENGDFKGVFEMEQIKFEKLAYFKRLELMFLGDYA